MADTTKSGEEESADLSSKPPLEDDEEKVKKGKGLKIVAPNKLITKHPVLLAQIKAWNNWHKSQHEIYFIIFFVPTQ